ncbi:AI-2E family transporter [Kordia sp. SMS9]|uniref:AI-2E family transporter n=1 Tax=Kordia sp. SMS9 TaxID=2282170 RepID=UPI000E0D83AA|nr:AI-2E family transporter [Kordia sp. SMS9]AXG71922.1 AI-2E family transporter [Kordia sp. SMS9]
MTPNTIANGILKALAIILGVFLLLYFLYKIQIVIVYITVAAVLSLIGRPAVRFLKRRLKFNNTVAVIFTMFLLISLFLGLISLFIPLIEDQGTKLSLFDIGELQAKMESMYVQIQEYFTGKGFKMEKSMDKSKIFSKIDYSVIPSFFNSLIGGLGEFSIGLLSVLFISFFLLKDSQLLQESVLVLFPDNKEKRLEKSFEKIKDLLSRYFVGLLFQILILFIFYTIILLIFGIDNAIVIAFLCALINLIPYVGPLFGGIIMMLLCFISGIETDPDGNIVNNFSTVILPNTIGVMIFFLVGQLLDNFISQPLIFSNSVKSHPLEIFLVIVIWGILFGIIGMVVAVPSYTALKVILKEFLSDNKIVQSITKDM